MSFFMQVLCAASIHEERNKSIPTFLGLGVKKLVACDDSFSFWF